MDIQKTVETTLEKAQKTDRRAIFICSTDFENFYLGWLKVIDILKEDVRFRVRVRNEYYTVPNSSNSDGDGAWDENCSRKNYFLTKQVA